MSTGHTLDMARRLRMMNRDGRGEAVVAYFTCYFGLRLGQLGSCLDAQYLAEIRTGHLWHYGPALEVKTIEERSHCLTLTC